ncbi:hypothetical protein [Pelagicoccus sp. SDUM812002]|uniref:hypothetical protein n=1 Tax=Pelagicoccus sp. SDUM812002 TaxID=3041266 RepID=UPI00280F22E4|nr:hypothetical protein [Pelagicoccus sp. SDUM812002]MDQ8187594.1 hypothetical protein [Pelagicoccus sp. SDUM812002]
MVKKSNTFLLSLLAVIGSALFFVGCADDNDLEDAAESTGDAIEDAADNTGDAVEDAADEVKDATN